MEARAGQASPLSSDAAIIGRHRTLEQRSVRDKITLSLALDGGVAQINGDDLASNTTCGDVVADSEWLVYEHQNASQGV